MKYIIAFPMLGAFISDVVYHSKDSVDMDLSDDIRDAHLFNTPQEVENIIEAANDFLFQKYSCGASHKIIVVYDQLKLFPDADNSRN